MTSLEVRLRTGYDVNVRQMAADGIRVLGRITGASNRTLTVARNANEALNVADETFASFLGAASEFAAANPDLEVAEEIPPEPADLPATVAEVGSLDLRKQEITAIIWTTGYDYDYDWLQVPVLDDRDRPRQQRGISSVPGLYFLGLHWMHPIKSGLLSGVGDDAEYLAEHMDLTSGR